MKFAKGEFVSSGATRGRVENVSDDDQVTVTQFKATRGGWEPTLKRSNFQASALTRIDPLSAPDNGGSTRVRVVNRGNNSAELIIYADIGEGFFGGISSQEFSNQLSALGHVTDLTVRMNSCGGDVFEGIAMYNRLKEHSARVTMYVDGLAASIASILAMAADEIVVYESSTVMVHKPLAFVGGNSEDLTKLIDRLDKVEGQMLDIYSGRTGLDRDHLTQMLSAETWMTGEEAVSLGFADRLDEQDMAMAAAVKPNFTAKWFDHPPRQDDPEIVRRAKAQSASLHARSRSTV